MLRMIKNDDLRQSHVVAIVLMVIEYCCMCATLHLKVD